MFTLVKAFILIILIGVGVFVFTVAGLLFKVFKTSRSFSATNSRSNMGNSGRETNGQREENAQAGNQKVFSKDEGEYVDFVEIDENK